ncbi:MAG TPA: LysM domain-containing protein [Eubacteriaceae bacterium]|jgi:nucleoid-associated protein YgaU|nr:LysM domain-containing protein [Eubacteriaceae bacterium]
MSIAGKKIRVVNKFRLILAVLLLAIVMVFLSTSLIQIAKGQERPVYETYIVKKGDTLWNIARSYSSDEVDVRDVIFDISMHNNISGNEHIYPNQRLEIPVRQ